jgi:hypothetical protein
MNVFDFYVGGDKTRQNKMKILDVVILLLSVVNAQSKYVCMHVAYGRIENIYRIYFSPLRFKLSNLGKVWRCFASGYTELLQGDSGVARH